MKTDLTDSSATLLPPVKIFYFFLSIFKFMVDGHSTDLL